MTLRGDGTPDAIPGPPKDEAMMHRSDYRSINAPLFHRSFTFSGKTIPSTIITHFCLLHLQNIFAFSSRIRFVAPGKIT